MRADDGSGGGGEDGTGWQQRWKFTVQKLHFFPPGALPDGGRGLGGRELGPPALLYRVRHQLRDLLT